MSIFRIVTRPVTFDVIAEDELDALSKATDSTLLIDGDEGNVESIPEPEGLIDYTPEGP